MEYKVIINGITTFIFDNFNSVVQIILDKKSTDKVKIIKTSSFNGRKVVEESNW